MICSLTLTLPISLLKYFRGKGRGKGTDVSNLTGIALSPFWLSLILRWELIVPTYQLIKIGWEVNSVLQGIPKRNLCTT